MTYSCLNHVEPERRNLIKGLQVIQETEGYLSEDALLACSAYFGVPPAEVEGVVSFYAQFKRVKPGRFRVSVCDGTACHIKGSALVGDWISTELGIRDGETDEKGLFSLETVACLGCCSLAPVIAVNGEVSGNLDRRQSLKIIKKYRRQG